MNHGNESEGVGSTPAGEAAPCERCGAPLVGNTPCAACILEGAQQGARGSISSGAGRAAFEAPSIAALAEALPAYDVQVLIGQGGMGAVYRARHRYRARCVVDG